MEIRLTIRPSVATASMPVEATAGNPLSALLLGSLIEHVLDHLLACHGLSSGLGRHGHAPLVIPQRAVGDDGVQFSIHLCACLGAGHMFGREANDIAIALVPGGTCLCQRRRGKQTGDDRPCLPGPWRSLHIDQPEEAQ
ncbi:hypothetical protein ABIE13_005557 [Ottowia thiooxydans]|uniref:Uncharacterized protein n=1 Tax=Ottowia thiooxydans TaxID=219182 RepID=A0ABV2QH96_9BURK